MRGGQFIVLNSVVHRSGNLLTQRIVFIQSRKWKRRQTLGANISLFQLSLSSIMCPLLANLIIRFHGSVKFDLK